MADRARLRLISSALAAAALAALPRCAGPYYDAPSPPYPPYYYDYYYYPHLDVYFHIYTGYYWYQSGGYWHRVHKLPPHIHLDPRYRVVIRIPDDRPYVYHDEHRRKYLHGPQSAPQPTITPPGPPQSGVLPPESRPEPRAPAPTRLRPAPLPPQTPPSYQHEDFEARQRESRQRDQEERQHNRSIFKEYRKKPWPPGR